MAHVDIRWRPSPELGLDLLVAEVRVGPDADHLRVAGELTCHASEMNAIDRLLQTGSLFHCPAHTYAIHTEEEVLLVR